MKSSFTIVLAWLYALVSCLALTGCLSSQVSKSVTETRADVFVPSALYQSANGDVAVEGQWHKPSKKEAIHAYLMIPQKVLIEAHNQSGGDVLFSDIRSLPPNILEKLQLQKHLPSDYKKVDDVPENQERIRVNEVTKVNAAAVGMLPFAFALDAAAFPLEMMMINSFNKSF